MSDPIKDIPMQPIPNDSILHGIINNGYITGISTSTWNARSGGNGKILFKGTDQQIEKLAQMAREGGYEYSITGGHIWSLEIIFPYDIILDASTGESDPLFTWEIINTAFEKDILELGDRKFNSNLSADTVAAIEAKLKNPTEGQPYTPADANSGVAAVNAIVAYTLKSIGVHGRQASLQTIRKTMIIGNQFKSNTPTLMSPGFDYKLFTTPQWRTQYNNDTNVLNQMPTLMYDSLLQSLTVASYIPRSNPPSSILQPTIGWNMDQKGIVTFIGWLQFPAEYQMVSNNKVQITQNWTFNQWSAGDWGLYDPAIPIGTPPNPNDVLHIPTPHP